MNKLCLILTSAVLLIGCSQDRTEVTGVANNGELEYYWHAYIEVRVEGEADMPFPGVAKLWQKIDPDDEWQEVDSVQWAANDPRPILSCQTPSAGSYLKWIGVQTGQTSPPNSWEDDTGYYYENPSGAENHYYACIFHYR